MWASLRYVGEPIGIRAGEGMIECLKKHAGNVKKIGLNYTSLVKGQDDCTSLLTRIRRAVSLDELCAAGSSWPTSLSGNEAS